MQMLGRPILRKQVSEDVVCPVAVTLLFFLDQLQHVPTFSYRVGQYLGRFAILGNQGLAIQHYSVLPFWHASISWSVLHFPRVQLHRLPCHARLLPHFRSRMC